MMMVGLPSIPSTPGLRKPGRRGLDLAFDPAQLFASGEQGAWYDPSDLSTMFTDTDGTTPANVGDPVALLLDKSQGLELGPELVTNGTFESPDGWDIGSGAVISNGVATFPFGTRATISQPIDLVAGAFYEISFTISRRESGTIRFDFEGDENTPVAQENRVGSYKVIKRNSGGGNALRVITTNENTEIDIDNISVRELPGNHATQETAAARPILRQTAGGLYYLEFDGVDDALATAALPAPGVDKAQVFGAARNLTNSANIGTLTELGPNMSTDGSLNIRFPFDGDGRRAFFSRGTTNQRADSGIYAAPMTSVVSGLGDISGNSLIIRIDGAQVDENTGNQGASNYNPSGTYPLYIGARAGTSNRFNGHIYSLIVRFGANLDTPTIENVEGFVANKTGVTL